jgi:hypothetical protein
MAERHDAIEVILAKRDRLEYSKFIFLAYACMVVEGSRVCVCVLYVASSG